MILEVFKGREKEEKRIVNRYNLDTPHEAEDIYMNAVERFIKSPSWFPDDLDRSTSYFRSLLGFAAADHLKMLNNQTAGKEKFITLNGHITDGTGLAGSQYYTAEDVLNLICKHFTKPKEVDALVAHLIDGQTIKSLDARKKMSKSTMYRLVTEFRDKVVEHGDLHELSIRRI